MSHQFSDFALSPSAIRFHLTSLNPLNAKHKPDEWETSALTDFQNGLSARNSVSTIDGKKVYRYMQSIPADISCFRCHGEETQAPGKSFAALSIFVPEDNINNLVLRRQQKLEVTCIFFAIFGLIAMLIVNIVHQKQSRRLLRAKRHLKLAYMDVLTLLPNRRYYDFFVKREWKRAMRQSYPISMIMIDIDYFKNYNDHFGHIQGDYCLQQVAKTLRRHFRRADDLIARYGGEEFCVVAACDAEQIKRLAEILRIAVEAIKLPHPGSEVSAFVTISLGIATVIPTETMPHQMLLELADKSLYLAKQKGRNRVARYIPETMATDISKPPPLKAEE